MAYERRFVTKKNKIFDRMTQKPILTIEADLGAFNEYQILNALERITFQNYPKKEKPQTGEDYLKLP